MMPPLYKPIVEIQSSITGSCKLSHVEIAKEPEMAIPASTSATEVTTFAGLISLMYPNNFFNVILFIRR
jgi:hypothetical protein